MKHAPFLFAVLVILTLAAIRPYPMTAEDSVPTVQRSDFLSIERERLEAYLVNCDPRYSEEYDMLGLTFSSPGYHTNVPNGEWVHPTRQTLDYATALLERNEEGDAERSGRIISAVLKLQETREGHSYRGVWPWLMEESVDEMSPPDRNWSDFCGARLAQMLIDYPELIPTSLQAEVKDALRLAADQIRTRNVGPGYTNIAIMGGGVAVACGELLDDPTLVVYGRERLEKVVDYFEENGGFSEYNSPTYTRVALEEADRALYLVRDEASRDAAQRVRRFAWEAVAESFHPATRQWAGPHARAYGDLLDAATLRQLSEATGLDLSVSYALKAEAEKSELSMSLTPHLACPDDLVERFRSLPSEEPYEIRRTFQANEDPEKAVHGTTWMSEDACFGTVNRSEFWTQRRPIIAYWAMPNAAPAVFRVRFLHDGEDFASMGVRCLQNGSTVYGSCEPLRNKGSWHLSLDRPEDGVFVASDFRLRFELTADGAEVDRVKVHSQSDSFHYRMLAGDYFILISAMNLQFDEEKVQVEMGVGESGKAYVDFVCHTGEAQDFDFHDPPRIFIHFSLGLISVDEIDNFGGDFLPEDEASE